MLNTLEQITAYKHPAVVKRFSRDFPEKAARAEVIFEDLMRFFYGTRKHVLDKAHSPDNPKFGFVYIMDDDMREIDQMWHTFLLYTRDYKSFCETHIGEFLHHQPDLVPIFETRGFEFSTNLESFLDYNFDLFGEAVVSRWFAPTLQAN